jgi:hypothetical protein
VSRQSLTRLWAMRSRHSQMLVSYIPLGFSRPEVVCSPLAGMPRTSFGQDFLTTFANLCVSIANMITTFTTLTFGLQIELSDSRTWSSAGATCVFASQHVR